jgi:hypothetical protein
LSPPEGFLRLPAELKSGDYKYAVGSLVGHLAQLQVSTGGRLPQFHSRISGSRQVFAWPSQYLFDFLFSYTVRVDMRLADIVVKVVPYVHLLATAMVPVHVLSVA